jgi:hypothetical protein
MVPGPFHYLPTFQGQRGPRMFYPCVNVNLGTIYIYTKFQPDRTSNMAAVLEYKLSAITPGLSPNFNHGTSSKDT